MNNLDDVNLSWIEKRMKRHPVEFWMYDVNKKIKEMGLQQITSHAVFEPTSKKFHDQGLFSETIFGSTIDTRRFITMAYIDLKTDVFQPPVYDIIVGLKKIYENIMAGRTVARFDEAANDFVVCDKFEEGAGTGYSFFVENFKRKKFDPANYDSLKRKNEIVKLNKYKDVWFCDKHIILPAGIRDIKEEGGRIAQESINRIYLSLLSLSNSFFEKSNNPIYDGVRFSIQKKVHESYKYIEGFTRYKGMFIQKNFGARSVALGTRNVASAPITSGKSPDDPTVLKYDETQIPLYQGMKMYQHNVIYYLKEIIFKEIFNGNKVYMINGKTGTLHYVNILLKEKEKFTTDKNLEKILNQFKYEHFRNSPVSITGTDKNKYYYANVYDDGDIIYIYRSIKELFSYMGVKDDFKLDKSKVRYLTWVELLYIVTTAVTSNKNLFTTRYPAIEDGSSFPSKVHLISTIPSRSVKIRFYSTEMKFYHYPIIGNKYGDTVSVHNCRSGGLGLDFDGDQINNTGLMADDSNQEIQDYYNSLLSIIDSNYELIASGDLYQVNLVLQNVTRDM